MSSMNEFRHNEFTRQEYSNNTNSYTIKVNSRDRNIQSEKSPFNFTIKFNRVDTKYTNYYTNNWWDTTSTSIQSKTIKVNNGAVIEDAIENVKDFRISEIVAPRFIPDDNIGKYVENITITVADNADNKVYFKSTDETKTQYLEESGISFIKLTDFNQNIYYLFTTSDISSLSSDFKKTFGLNSFLFTNILLLNGELYTITSIGDTYLVLNKNISGSFIETNIYLPTYYQNLIYHNADNINGWITDTSTTFTMQNSGHLINHSFLPGSYLEIFKNTIAYYFKISSIRYTFDFKDDGGNILKTESKDYPDIIFSDTDLESIKSGLNGTPAVDVTVVFTGEWVNPTTYTTTIFSANSDSVRVNHFRSGMKDLLNEKLFYLSIDPITPSKSLITNGKLNNVLGTLYPSTQSRNYIYLVGKYLGKNFNHRNLQNLKDLKFTLYYKDGSIVGSNLKNYTLDYLEKDCRQLMISFNVDQVDRSF